MKPIRVLVGSAVVLLVLGCALLEMAADRVRFEARSGVSDPDDEGWDEWPDVPGTEQAGPGALAGVSPGGPDRVATP